MQIEENGQGTLRNNLSGKLAYYSFFPTPLQSLRQLNLTEETYRTLSACSRKLGELEGMLYFVPNADMYLTMYVRKEALLSSQIEGTQCTFDDLLSPSQTQLHHKDVADVVNYVRAVDRGVELLKKMPCARDFLGKFMRSCWTECAERRRIQASCAPHKTGLAPQAAPLQPHRLSLQTLKI